MSYRAPGMLDGDDAVERDEARTEMLAQAFADVADEYFERRVEYEDSIEEAEERMDRMELYRNVGAVAAAVFLILTVVFLRDSLGLLFLLGVVAAIGSAVYAHVQYTNEEERKRDLEAEMEADEPEGEVTFVSQVGVPMYLVPYGDRHMIFDGLARAPRTEVQLANIDGGALAAEEEDLERMRELYDEYLDGETVVSPEFAAQFSPGIEEHRQLEYPIVDQIDSMTDIAGDVDRETITVDVHANNRKSRSVRAFADDGVLESNGDLSTVETSLSMGECREVISEIRGVEEQAIGGDLLDQAEQSRRRVNEIATDLAERLEDNERRVEDHYESYATDIENTTAKHVCEECLSDRIEEIDDELDLVDQILSSEAGSLGTALSDPDLDEGVDEAFTERIREDIQAQIPELGGSLRDAYNDLTDLGVDGGYCGTHGSVETTRIEDSGAVFGEVWRSLYYRFREPIMESAEDLEREAEDVRQNKEQKMIDLTQYEQIKDEVEQRYHSVRSEYEAAQMIENELG